LEAIHGTMNLSTRLKAERNRLFKYYLYGRSIYEGIEKILDMIRIWAIFAILKITGLYLQI